MARRSGLSYDGQHTDVCDERDVRSSRMNATRCNAVSVNELSPRCNGYVDLRSYAVVGDGRTVALISHDGSVD